MRANEVTSADGGWRVLFASVAQWPAAAEFCRYRDVKLHSPLFGWSNPDQTLRVAAGILGKRASGGTTWALQVRCQGCEAFPTMYRTWKPQSGLGLESEDRVKEIERLQASLKGTSQMSAERLEPKGKQSSPGALTSPGANSKDCRCTERT